MLEEKNLKPDKIPQRRNLDSKNSQDRKRRYLEEQMRKSENESRYVIEVKILQGNKTT